MRVMGVNIYENAIWTRMDLDMNWNKRKEMQIYVNEEEKKEYLQENTGEK